MLQLSGAHLHADEHGYVGAPEVSYSHTHVHPDAGHVHQHADGGAHSAHDHDDARDVSLVDPALSSFKLPFALFALFILFALVPQFRIFGMAEFLFPILSGRFARWRPPLRAPPLSA